MTTPSLLPLTRERQDRLTALLQQDGAEPLFLREALQVARECFGVESLAVYLQEGCELELLAHLGGADFPPALGAEAVPWSSHRVAGGLLVSDEPLASELPEPLPLLLAAGLRLCHLRQGLKRRDFDAKYRGVEREALYDVGLAIASTLDLGSLSEEILLRAVSLLDARRGALFLLDGDGELYRRRATIGGAARDSLAVGFDAEDADLLPAAHHVLAVPVEVEGDRRGFLVVGDKESRSGVGPFPDQDRRALALFANQAALALEQARLHQEALEKERLEREMELAAQIQRGILPRSLPVLPGWELFGWTRPARHVGGDYWDVMPLPGGRTALLVADVSGKGVSAALLVSTLHSALRLLLGRGETSVGLLRAVNQHLIDFSAANKFATLLLAVLDDAAGTVAWVNAGHNPGLVLRADGSVGTLDAGAVPLGLLPVAAYHENLLALAPGDVLCLYSDGVTEAASKSGEEYGQERLEAFLRRYARSPLPDLRTALEDELRDLTRGLPQGDDQTVLLLRRRAETALAAGT